MGAKREESGWKRPLSGGDVLGWFGRISRNLEGLYEKEGAFQEAYTTKPCEITTAINIYSELCAICCVYSNSFNLSPKCYGVDSIIIPLHR